MTISNCMSYLCFCRCREKTKPLPHATPLENIAVKALFDLNRPDSPLSLPSALKLTRERPIELKEITHSRFFSTDIVSIKTALKQEDI